MTCPTEKQYGLLRNIGGGAAWLSARKRDCEPLLKRGWVTGDWRPPYYQCVRITPDGLRALAVAVEKFGLPSLKSPLETAVRVCGDCGTGWRPKCRCGSRHWRYEIREVEAA